MLIELLGVKFRIIYEIERGIFVTIYQRARDILDKTIKPKIDLGKLEAITLPIIIFDYKIRSFSELLNEIAYELEDCSVVSKRKKILAQYKFVREHEKVAVDYFLRGLKGGTITIEYEIEKSNEEFVYDLTKADATKGIEEIIEERIRKSLESQKLDIMEQLYLMRHHEFIFSHQNEYGIISGNYDQQFLNSIVLYKNMFIEYQSIQRIYILKYNKEETHGLYNDFMNILSFLLGRPLFLYNSNYEYDKKIEELYDQCELFDMVKLRRNKLFQKEREDVYFSTRTIFRSTCPYRVTQIPDMQHPAILELYNAALKQVEPLPKCVFLYRVIEYAIEEDYKRTVRPSNFEVNAALEYYLEKARKYNFIPLYYIDLGRYYSREKDKFIETDKTKMKNLWTTLKRMVPGILNEWSQHTYLRNKQIGDIIYSSGRCATAHGHTGMQGCYNARYDYQYNYFHINDVNILLELMSRYVVELLNPELKKLTVKERKPYLETNNSYINPKPLVVKIE